VVLASLLCVMMSLMLAVLLPPYTLVLQALCRAHHLVVVCHKQLGISSGITQHCFSTRHQQPHLHSTEERRLHLVAPLYDMTKWTLPQ